MIGLPLSLEYRDYVQVSNNKFSIVCYQKDDRSIILKKRSYSDMSCIVHVGTKRFRCIVHLGTKRFKIGALNYALSCLGNAM